MKRNEGETRVSCVALQTPYDASCEGYFALNSSRQHVILTSIEYSAKATVVARQGIIGSLGTYNEREL